MMMLGLLNWKIPMISFIPTTLARLSPNQMETAKMFTYVTVRINSYTPVVN